MENFTGFPAVTRDLSCSNNKMPIEYYQASYVEPAKQFVVAAGDRLCQFARTSLRGLASSA